MTAILDTSSFVDNDYKIGSGKIFLAAMQRVGSMCSYPVKLPSIYPWLVIITFNLNLTKM